MVICGSSVNCERNQWHGKAQQAQQAQHHQSFQHPNLSTWSQDANSCLRHLRGRAFHGASGEDFHGAATSTVVTPREAHGTRLAFAPAEPRPMVGRCWMFFWGLGLEFGMIWYDLVKGPIGELSALQADEILLWSPWKD